MKRPTHNFRSRIESLRLRIESLSGLRKSVALPPAHDISERQWFVIESELKAVEIRLLRRLKKLNRTYLPQLEKTGAARDLNAGLGEIELEMSKAFAFFDTYADLLTQRLMPEIGRLLAGCDVLALEALKKDHPALAIVEPPLVYCDRGFGASTLREGVTLPGRGYNPMPLVQIPYSRLKEKCNLTSIFHEAGHEAMVRLNLVTSIPKAFAQALGKAGASSVVRDSFALWSSEIGPDFWAFCSCGIAQTATIKEILALPPGQVFRIPWGDPHPPPYLRALLTFDWCRQVWGGGIWDDWEREWLDLYPMQNAPVELREIIGEMRRFVPIIGRVLLKAKFRALNGKPIPELFNLAAIAPSVLKNVLKNSEDEKLNLKGLSPATQLSVFRIFKEEKKIEEEKLDKIMTGWLLKLGEQKQQQQKI
jgi:hypothetical protein